ncbi:hypothetical protein HAX54_050883, partial [Datura stramonium]|nr:hypothetical protein [Datura stramonium]
HMDLVFYYLRKKDKYDIKSTYKYTTTDCISKIRIGEIYDKYVDTSGDSSVAREEDVICHDAVIHSEIGKLAKLLPLYLSIYDWIQKSTGLGQVNFTKRRRELIGS